MHHNPGRSSITGCMAKAQAIVCRLQQSSSVGECYHAEASPMGALKAGDAHAGKCPHRDYSLCPAQRSSAQGHATTDVAWLVQSNPGLPFCKQPSLIILPFLEFSQKLLMLQRSMRTLQGTCRASHPAGGPCVRLPVSRRPRLNAEEHSLAGAQVDEVLPWVVVLPEAGPALGGRMLSGVVAV